MNIRKHNPQYNINIHTKSFSYDSSIFIATAFLWKGGYIMVHFFWWMNSGILHPLQYLHQDFRDFPDVVYYNVKYSKKLNMAKYLVQSWKNISFDSSVKMHGSNSCNSFVQIYYLFANFQSNLLDWNKMVLVFLGCL